MVIFIAGLIGVGKTSLAKGVAKELNIFYYDVDAVKKEIYPADPHYEKNLKNNIPFSDATRRKVFEKVIKDFPRLAQEHPHIIIDETLHKKSLRRILFKGAKKVFGDYLIVWIKADEDLIKKRLTKAPRKGHMLKDPFGMYLSFKGQFEDFENADIIFWNDAPLDKSTQKLAELVRNKMEFSSSTREF